MESVSIIIPTLQEAKLLPFLLKDIAALRPRPLETIVVDGGSTDGTHEQLKQTAQLKLIHAKANTAQQRNTGAKEASGEWLFFLDADVRLSASWIAQALTEIDKKQLDCAVPRYVPEGATMPVRLFFRIMNFLFWLGKDHSPSGAGSAILIRRVLFEKINGFGTYKVGEDIDLIRRAARSGRFGTLTLPIAVSDRRFRKHGFLATVWLYTKISYFFLHGNFDAASRVAYPFGHYHDEASDSSKSKPSGQ